jgi:drug/metabolite transporter (DMT)-like permease
MLRSVPILRPRLHASNSPIPNRYPPFDYSVATGVKVAHLSVIFVGMVAFNNLCLQYVEVSFYNVARSLTIVFNVVLTYVFLGERTSLPTIVTLAVVIGGFMVRVMLCVLCCVLRWWYRVEMRHTCSLM